MGINVVDVLVRMGCSCELVQCRLLLNEAGRDVSRCELVRYLRPYLNERNFQLRCTCMRADFRQMDGVKRAFSLESGGSQRTNTRGGPSKGGLDELLSDADGLKDLKAAAHMS